MNPRVQRAEWLRDYVIRLLDEPATLHWVIQSVRMGYPDVSKYQVERSLRVLREEGKVHFRFGSWRLGPMPAPTLEEAPS